MSKRIIVSNRLPVKFKRKTGNGVRFQIIPSEGGLATGLKTVIKPGDIWIGWPGLVLKTPAENEAVQKELGKKHLLPVFLQQKELERFYLGFSNETIWPAFHYMSTITSFSEKNWKCYQEVNEKYAAAVLSVLESGDTVWIHDYHLLLLPAMIRNVRKDVSIGFFLHIPFPSFEIFRILPWRKELISGMLGADLLGFHTMEDLAHFLDCAARIGNRHINANKIEASSTSPVTFADVFPISIDFDKFEKVAGLPKTQKQMKDIESVRPADGKFILTIDRLDYTKGILSRLRAFEYFLEHHEDWVEKVVLEMIVVPSRDAVPKYKNLKDDIDQLVGNINATYRTLHWQPIQYYYRSFNVEHLSALYQTADVCLVTPMRDGMNLVSKEYVASRLNEDGVLILSEMAGASKELQDAVIVNPHSMVDLSTAIETALSMSPEEQKRRMSQMRMIVRKFDVRRWANNFMEQLHEVKDYQKSMHTKLIENSIGLILQKVANADEVCYFLDYDGTLVGFNNDIHEAKPDAELYEILKKLTKNPHHHVIIISGRNKDALNTWFGHLPVSLIGEHGVWYKDVDTDWQEEEGVSDRWKPVFLPHLQMITDRTPGSFIEEKSNSLVWHYRNSDAELAQLRASEIASDLSLFAANNDLQIMSGDKVIEIKNASVNKGVAALKWLARNHVSSDCNIIIGDDVTDEYMFTQFRGDNDITIKVGEKLSVAKYNIKDFKAVRSFLNHF